jgi:hypothetical protein
MVNSVKYISRQFDTMTLLGTGLKYYIQMRISLSTNFIISQIMIVKIIQIKQIGVHK